jgi:hypothetical protein
MFIAAVFMIAKLWKQLRLLNLMNGDIYEIYSAIRMNKII